MLTDTLCLKHIGPKVKIYELAKIARPEAVQIGEGTQIDDFVFINGGNGVKIGHYNHIASFVSVVGGGELITGDYVGIAAGARIITGTHHYGDGKRISPLIPEEEQCVIRGIVVLERDVFIGTNAIIHPNVTVGEGAIIGSGGLVLKDVEPWTINVGVPVRVIGHRPKVRSGA
ncbi:MAG: acyltransferase [Anaerolineae bacterium]|nr:MAG: acyltransferase [Anaerolineae bacterium]